MPNTFEVGIVGAGAAGSVCAQILGKANMKVAVFDNSHPREKPCGGLIDARVVDEFEIPYDLLENEINWLIVERFRLRTRLLVSPSVFLTSRRKFDYYLLQRAVKNNSVTFFNEKILQIVRGKEDWTLVTNTKRIVKARKLIGADGCPSLVRRQIFEPIHPKFLATTIGYDYLCSKVYMEKNFPKNTIETYYSRKYVPNRGFIWIFPKKDSINVGIGCIEGGKKLKQCLDNFLFFHPAGRRTRNLTGRLYAHLIPTIWKREFYDAQCSGDTWALIGDAAGHVNPLNGVGIYYAMKGGKLCASALLDGDLHLFEDYWRKDYGDELYYGARTVLRYYSNLDFFPWLIYTSNNLLNQRSHTEDIDESQCGRRIDAH